MTSDSARNLAQIAETHQGIDLDRVYREHGAMVSRWVRRLSGPGDPSDALQEVFEVAQRRLPSFRGDAALTTWLYSITVRVVSSRRRKARLRRLFFSKAATEFEVTTQPTETPLDSLRRQRARNIVYAVLDRLSERDRTLLILFELERLSTDEIALMLALSLNNVSVSLHRARRRFRTLFRLHFPDEAEGMDDGQLSA